MKNNEIGLLNLDRDTEVSFGKHLTSIINFEDTILVLQDRLKRFNQKISENSHSNELLDIDLAEELSKKASALLSISKSAPNPQRDAYILAAVRYLVDADDASHDFDNIDGFDDDEQVMNSVIKKFELEEKIQAMLGKDGSNT